MRWHAHQAALYLDHVRGMGVQIVTLTLAIAALEAKADGLKGLDYSKDQVSMSVSDDAMLNNVSELIRQKQERERKRMLYETELAAVSRAFDRMPNSTYAAILDGHYIGEASWQDLADKIGYTKRGMMKVRQRALAMFYDCMPPSQSFVDVPKAI